MRRPQFFTPFFYKLVSRMSIVIAIFAGVLWMLQQ